MYDRRSLKDISLILIGSTILAFGVYNFYYLNSITEGGVLGIILLLKNIFGFDVSIAGAILDIALLIMGFKMFGKKFFVYSVGASVGFSVLYDIFETVGPLVPQMGMFTSAVLGGLSVGIGCGIMMRVGCASGGDDALAMIISKVTSLKLSTVYLITDGVVLLLSVSYIPAVKLVYSIVAVLISGKTIDFIYGLGRTNRVEVEKTKVPAGVHAV
ncbi:YitT family protein [Peptacetobacter sp. AB845]|uniref:YitT family protein n=1 Tax=Peptacetobacter sp. AB845 TaxID=3388429 RepID=UPI0039C9D46E